MVVLRDPGEVYLLCHIGGDEAVSWLEQIDPLTLATLRRSPDLPGGPTWPGGVAAHENGSLYVVFGEYIHRLSPQLELLVSSRLPRHAPYNSFVILPDGSLVTKDFGGARPGDPLGTASQDCELLVLSPDDLEIRARVTVPEGSIARLSANDFDIYVVGTQSLWRATWRPTTQQLEMDEDFHPRYRRAGEGYGWDCVLADGSAWFLNNGEGAEQFAGSLRGLGVARVPEAIVRVDLSNGLLTRYDVNEHEGGIVANPPAISVEHHVVIGYDSGNGVVTAWNYLGDSPSIAWTAQLNHGAHPLMGNGRVVLQDFDEVRGMEQLVVLDVVTGSEIARVDTGSPWQSVVFMAAGFNNDIYYCSFLTVSRIAFPVG
jgi:hypothetical protein